MAFRRQTVLCLMVLCSWPICSKAEEFPQCVNADPDTFVMAIDDCAAYIYCNGQDSFRDSCPDQTYFDDRTQECAFDDAGVCLKGVEIDEVEADASDQPAAEEVATPSLTPLPATTPEEAITTETPPTSSRPSTRPHCDSTRDSVHPHPQRCEYFYRCVGGFLTIVRCPFNYAWDSPTDQCRPKADAHCFSL